MPYHVHTTSGIELQRVSRTGSLSLCVCLGAALLAGTNDHSCRALGLWIATGLNRSGT